MGAPYRRVVTPSAWVPSPTVLPLHDDNPTRRRPWVTLALIAINVVVYFAWQPQGATTVEQQVTTIEFTYEHAAVPCELTSGHPLTVLQYQSGCEADGGRRIFPGKSVWLAVVVSMFLHGGLLHLGGNMLFLWIFGNNVEDRLGRVGYLVFYLAAGILATLAHVALQPHSTDPVIGASGAIAGVMGAYLVWFPNARVFTAFFLVLVWFRQIRAKWVLGFWFLSQFLISPNEGVASAAHVGGFVVGVLVALLLRPFLRADSPRRPGVAY
jgi:membrane associated rhomboid family serine protease